MVSRLLITDHSADPSLESIAWYYRIYCYNVVHTYFTTTLIKLSMKFVQIETSIWINNYGMFRIGPSFLFTSVEKWQIFSWQIISKQRCRAKNTK